MMFRSLHMLTATVFLLAVDLAQAAPKTFQELGVSFSYDDAVLPELKAKRVKAIAQGDPSEKPDGVAPAHVFIEFTGDRGGVWVYPTSDPAQKNFRRSFPTIDDAQKELTTVLKERSVERKDMPVMPWADVAVGFNKKIQYLDFRSGSGVVWLTQWSVDVGPINNAELWYVFQGLTKDGTFYVAAQFRVQHPSLPATGETKNPEAFEKGYAAYLKKAVPALVKQPDESFQPSLSALRALLGSIEVGGK